jgi:polysaccharide pyruvyl transferase WcaK-like protein
MKFVVMGDIGKQILYHVGDEAMTEAAIAMLRQRDADAEITLVATDPEVAEERYGLPAVPRFGYLFDWSRLRLEAALSDVTAGIPGDHGRLHDSVREADAVVIAGGGNMNSKFAYHLYERASLKRVAEH